jgi:hypothetical protein
MNEEKEWKERGVGQIRLNLKDGESSARLGNVELLFYCYQFVLIYVNSYAC